MVKYPETSNEAFNYDLKRVCETAEINESIKFSYKKDNRVLHHLLYLPEAFQKISFKITTKRQHAFIYVYLVSFDVRHL